MKTTSIVKEQKLLDHAGKDVPGTREPGAKVHPGKGHFGSGISAHFTPLGGGIDLPSQEVEDRNAHNGIVSLLKKIQLRLQDLSIAVT